MPIVHEAASNSFKDGSKAELQKWWHKLRDSLFNLHCVAAKQDPENLAALQTLIII